MESATAGTLLLLARADLRSRLQLGDRAADVPRVGGLGSETQVPLVRQQRLPVVALHRVRHAQPAIGLRDGGLVLQRSAEAADGLVHAAALERRLAGLTLR